MCLQIKKEFFNVLKIIFKIFKNTWSYYFSNIEFKIGKILKEKKLKVSTAESCTGGLISSRLTDISGSSNYVKINFVTYANEAKENFLGVLSETLENFGAVSEKCAFEMAQGILKNNPQIDIAISITGFLGPTGDSKTKKLGLVYICVASNEKYVVKKYNMFSRNPYKSKSEFKNNLIRKYSKVEFSQAALKLLYDFLLKYYAK